MTEAGSERDQCAAIYDQTPLRDPRIIALGEAYAATLPLLTVGRDPVDGTPLRMHLDHTDLGPWWHAYRPFPVTDPPRPPRCVGVAGGLHLSARPLRTYRRLIMPGPAAPTVLADRMAPGIRAVIARIPLAQGDTAYVTSYWSQDVARAPWSLRPWGYLPRGDMRGPRVPPDPRDGPAYDTAGATTCDLAPWISSGDIGWMDAPDAPVRWGQVDCPLSGLADRPCRHLDHSRIDHWIDRGTWNWRRLAARGAFYHPWEG
jgi:hypothetical protein